MVANSSIETPIGIKELHFESADYNYRENSIFMIFPPQLIRGQSFQQAKVSNFDVRQVSKFFLSMQLQQEAQPHCVISRQCGG